ncbi:MAG: hypothetical protein U0457_05170 [Candidatus Sericytochromatia bacterium]
MKFPKLDFLVNKELDLLYQDVLELFQKEKISVHKPEYLNEIILAKDFARVFNVYEDDVKHTFFIINEPFNDDKISKILNSFTSNNEKSLIHFYSFYPLPDILKYLSNNTLSSFLELECIKYFKSYKKDIYDLEYFSEKLSIFLKKIFNLDLKKEPKTDLKIIENILGTHFRKVDDYETIYDTDIEYFPYYSLVFFSFHLANLMCSNLKGEVFYDQNNDIQSLGVGFSFDNSDMIEISAHPFDKVFKYFFYGKDSSIINWFYDIKYLLSQKQKST